MPTLDIEIFQAVPGHLRLRIPALATDTTLADRLTAGLALAPGVHATVEAATCGLTVQYDAALYGAPADLLNMARAFPGVLPGLDLDRLAAQLAAVEQPPRPASRPRRQRPTRAASTCNGGDAAVAATGHEPTAIDCTILHRTSGRLRLHLGPPSLFNGHRAGLEAALRGLPGVTGVQVTSACQSVVVQYKPAEVTGTDLVARIARLAPATFPPSDRSQPPQGEDRTSWWSLALAGAAWLAGPGVGSWLLAGAALPIFQRAYTAVVTTGRPNVDTLDATATLLLLLQGQVATASTMVGLVSLGHAITDFTLHQSRRALEGLYDGKSQTAWVVRRGRKRRVPVEQVQPGDEVVVYPGELVPVDGTVVSGDATVDQAVLTGESLPVRKAIGDAVFATTVVRDGKLYVRVTHVGQSTKASAIVRLVREAPIRGTRIQNYAETFADDLVPWTLAGTGGLLAVGDPVRASSVAIIDYATGIRIAAPTAVLSSMARAARRGILIKGGRALERLAEVDALIFDKTGTLTLGTQEIVRIVPLNGTGSEERVLALAAAAERRLTHPVAQAIVRTAQARGVAIPERSSSEYQIGLGVAARVNGFTVRVGAPRFLQAQGVAMADVEAEMRWADEHAASPVCLAIDNHLAGLLFYTDPLRPEASDVIAALRARGVRDLVMLTGDRAAVATKVAGDLGIPRTVAEAMPDQKMAVVKELQAAGRRVGVVGDGINDSPALAQADVGIAVHGGADVAQETADVVLLNRTLAAIPEAIDIARDAVALIHQSWNLNFYPNTASLALTLVGVLGPVGATLISNGAGVVSALNGTRPLLATDPRR